MGTKCNATLLTHSGRRAKDIIEAVPKLTSQGWEPSEIASRLNYQSGKKIKNIIECAGYFDMNDS